MQSMRSRRSAGFALIISVIIGWLVVFAPQVNAQPPTPTDPVAQFIEELERAGISIPTQPPRSDTPEAVPAEAPAVSTDRRWIPTPGKRFAVIGDSYGSGNGDAGTQDTPGPPRYDPGTTRQGENFCLQTPTASARKVANDLGYEDAKIDFHACTAATAENVLDVVQYPSLGLQIEAFGPDTELGIYQQGGNPWFFSLFKCFVLTFHGSPQGETCEQMRPGFIQQALDYYSDPDKLEMVTRRNLQAIHERSPDLKALAVPLYPPLMPQNLSHLGYCAAFADAAELESAKQLFSALNGTLRRVVAEFEDHNFFVVDLEQPESPFLQKDLLGFGTDACSINPFIKAFWLAHIGVHNPDNYADWDFTRVLNDVIAGTLHPNSRGWGWIAELTLSRFYERLPDR